MRIRRAIERVGPCNESTRRTGFGQRNGMLLFPARQFIPAGNRLASDLDISFIRTVTTVIRSIPAAFALLGEALLRRLAMSQPCVELVDQLFGCVRDHGARREDRLGTGLI